MLPKHRLGSLSPAIFLSFSGEIFKAALSRNAASVILVHNHPSGDPAPSREDIDVTKRVVEAGRLLQVPVNDHIVIGDGTYASLWELRYI